MAVIDIYTSIYILRIKIMAVSDIYTSIYIYIYTLNQETKNLTVNTLVYIYSQGRDSKHTDRIRDMASQH